MLESLWKVFEKYVFLFVFLFGLEASVVDVMVKRLDVADEAAVQALAKDLGQGNSRKARAKQKKYIKRY